MGSNNHSIRQLRTTAQMLVIKLLLLACLAQSNNAVDVQKMAKLVLENATPLVKAMKAEDIDKDSVWEQIKTPLEMLVKDGKIESDMKRLKEVWYGTADPVIKLFKKGVFDVDKLGAAELAAYKEFAAAEEH